MTTHFVNTSGGSGSWATGRRAAAAMSPGDHLVLCFADTNMEDEDLYRFLDESVANTLASIPEGTTGEFVRLADGRDVWEVFRDKRFLGNSRIDPCSKILKRDIIRKFIEETCDPADTIVYLGIDWTEAERYERAKPYWEPYTLAAPLCEAPLLSKDDILRWLDAEGIARPRLYAMGFPHNNCGGFCVKAGMASFRILLEQMPERYAYHEAKEQELREYLGKDVAILMDRTLAGRLALVGLTTSEVYRHVEFAPSGRVEEYRLISDDSPVAVPKKVPLTLREFRERVEVESIQVDPFDLGGCACFTPDDYAKDAKESIA